MFAEEFEKAQDRRDNYAMLARLFQCEVDGGLLSDLLDTFESAETGNAPFDEGCALMRAHLDGVRDLDSGKSELAIDYCLTFLGYGTSPDAADGEGLNAAYPYESIYRAEGKTLGGDRCASVSQAYRSGGFMPDMERIVAEDHMACELSFMRHLAAQEAAAWQRGDAEAAQSAREKSLAFLEEHLLEWIGPFRQAVERFSETGFYRGLVRMTQGWVEMDAEALVG